MAWTLEQRRAYHREYQKKWIARNRERWQAIKKRCNSKNKIKYNVTERAWRARNVEKVAGYGRERNLKSYGINEQQYQQMLEAQESRCGLCGKHRSEQHRKLHVDHDHTTNVVRKLLCSACNTGLGLLQDNPELLRRAADYIEAHR